MDNAKASGNKKQANYCLRMKNVVLIVFSCIFIYNVFNEVMTTRELQQNLAEAQVVASEILRLSVLILKKKKRSCRILTLCEALCAWKTGLFTRW